MDYIFINFKEIKKLGCIQCDVIIPSNTKFGSNSHRINYYRNNINGKLLSVIYIKLLSGSDKCIHLTEIIVKNCMDQLDEFLSKNT